MGYLDQAASLPALRAAVDVAARNRGAPGPDGVTVAAFAALGDAELSRLQEELLSGAYRPRPARRVRIPKPGGGYRNLAIGCVRDRVVQHALAATLAAALDGLLHPFAYAYRRGRSTHEALAAVDGALGAGREWALRTDIEAFFDCIPPLKLLDGLEEVTAEPLLTRVVAALLSAGSLAGGEIVDPGLGTPQGSPLSPWLANLYLVPFDRAVEAAGLTMVRYGDDLCICTVTRAEAQRARDVVIGALIGLHLRANQQKMEIRHRGEGFTFLGFQFDPHGRRPGARAARSLLRNLDVVLVQRPQDGHEEVDALLRGWLSYYGSFAGVDLPAAVRGRAEVLEARRAEAVQMGRPPARHEAPPPGQAPAAPPAGAGAPEERADLGEFGEAARLLAEARGAVEEAALRESLRQRLRIDASLWPELADALLRRDGPAAAEVLARAGRYGEASQAVHLQPRPGPAPEGGDDACERPRLSPRSGDAERLLGLFGGAEHVFMRDQRAGTRVERVRVAEPPSLEHASEHLAGSYWMGTYPLRANHSVRYAGVRVVERARKDGGARGEIAASVRADVQRLAAGARRLGLSPVLSMEPRRGYVVWLLLAEPVAAARARALVQAVVTQAGVADNGVTREIIPAQEVARPDKPGTAALWPLGLDPRTQERAWFCDDTLLPLADPCAYLRSLVPHSAKAVAEALGGVKPGHPPGAPAGSGPAAGAAAAAGLDAGPGAAGAAATPPAAGAPFHDLPRAKEVYDGCNVLRHFVDRARSGQGLATSERYFVADVLGRLGDEAAPALEAVLRHLDDYRPGLGARYLQRLYPHPTSCGRIRQKLPELTARVGCDCRFRVPPGGYPAPVLHAVGAAEVPGMSERVREAARKGGLARAAVAAMNEGRKELGQRAAALCARLSDLRRQQRLLGKTIEGVEAELDALLDEAGDAPLETPAGTLRRVREGEARRFVLEV